jgi:hypothetical protein
MYDTPPDLNFSAYLILQEATSLPTTSLTIKKTYLTTKKTSLTLKKRCPVCLSSRIIFSTYPSPSPIPPLKLANPRHPKNAKEEHRLPPKIPSRQNPPNSRDARLPHQRRFPHAPTLATR